MQFFKGSKKTNSNKSFFQNYSDHINAIEDKDRKVVTNLMSAKTLDQQLRILSAEALVRLSIFDALHDGHDYLDEVGGATVVPLLGVAASIALAAVAAWEGMQALAIKIGLMQNDREKHLSKAGEFLLYAGAALTLAVASFVKSVISLVSRPIVTAIEGWKPQDKAQHDRFIADESVVGNLGL